MRNLPFYSLLVVLSLSTGMAAQSETRLPAVSEFVLNDNASVNRVAAKSCTSLRVGGSIDETHLHKLFTAVVAVDSVFIDGLSIVQLPASVEKLRAKHIRIARCEKLDLASACSRISRMPELKSAVFTVPALSEFPASVRGLRHLEKLSFVNTDISLADGYALNHNMPGALYSESSTTLGFRSAEQGAAPLELTYGSYNSEISALHLSQLTDYFQGVPGAATKLASRTGKNVFRYLHPLVKKPIANTDVASNFYTFNAEKGARVSYPSGTKIYIPANAFVDKQGRTVTGEVTISYREFRDAADIIASGIPMKYDSAGQTSDFESAGMFELVAAAQGSEVNVAPGKNIQMQFAVTQPESSYNFYRLDEQKGWTFEGKPGPVIDNNGQAISASTSSDEKTPAVEKYLSLLIDEEYIENPDTTPFQQRFESLRYKHTREIPFREPDKNTLRRNRIIKLHRVSGSRNYTCFQLGVKDYERFPELKAYSGIVWMMNEKLSAKEFKERYGKKFSFFDIQVTGGHGGYVLRLKHFYGIVEIPVTAFHKKDKSLEKISSVNMHMRDIRYSARRTFRENQFNKDLMRDKRDYLKQLHKKSLKFLSAWKKARPLMDEQEKSMGINEWKEYVENELEREREQSMTGSALTNENLRRALSLSNTGIFNCDQILRLANPVKVLVTAKNVLGKVFPAIIAYVISKGKNMALTFPATSADKGIMLNFSQSDSTKIVLIDAAGRVAVIHGPTVGHNNNFKDGSTCEYTAEEFGEEPPPMAELRKILSWN
ncbi:MAG: hypothetical protein IM638_20295 [Bacteroidetes bacterium]|nr:hypothetical protein [Bacteroidota bacterium]